LQGVLLGQKSLTDLPDDNKFWQEIRQQVTKEIQPLFLELMLAGVEFATEAVNLVRKKAGGQKFNPHHSPTTGEFVSGGGGGGVGESLGGEEIPVGDRELNYMRSVGYIKDGRPGTYSVWRSGPLESGGHGGVFFASDKSGAEMYGGGHPKRYDVTVSKPMETTNQSHLLKAWFNINGMAGMQDRHPLWDGPKTMEFVDKKISARARKLGYDSIIYKVPAPPAARELVVLGTPKLAASTKAFAQKAGPIDTAIYIPDEDILAREIAAWLPTFTNAWYDTIEVTTRSRLRDVLAQAVREGQSIDWVYKSIEPLFGATRALRISQTEMTRIFAKGQDMVYAEAGIDTVEWRTVRDFAVCSDCAPLHGKRFPRSSGPRPPNHVICRCFMAPHITEEAAAEKFL